SFYTPLDAGCFVTAMVFTMFIRNNPNLNRARQENLPIDPNRGIHVVNDHENREIYEPIVLTDLEQLTEQNAELTRRNADLRRALRNVTDERDHLHAVTQMRTLSNTVASWYDDDRILSKFVCLISQIPCVAPVLDPDGNSLFEEDH